MVDQTFCLPMAVFSQFTDRWLQQYCYRWLKARISCTCTHTRDRIRIRTWPCASCDQQLILCAITRSQECVPYNIYIIYIHIIICCVAVIRSSVWDSYSHRSCMTEAPRTWCIMQTVQQLYTHPFIQTWWSSANNDDIYKFNSSLPSLWVCPITTAITWLLWGRRIGQQVFS